MKSIGNIMISILCAALCFLTTTSNAAEAATDRVYNLNQLVAIHSHLVELLSRQPDFEGHHPVGRHDAKILPLKDYTDCRIIEILHCNAEKKSLLPAGYPRHLGTFGCGNYQLTEGPPFWRLIAPHGIELWCSYTVDKQRLRRCVAEDIQPCYRQVVDILRCGWRTSTLAEYPTIFFKEDEAQWALFVKESSLTEEDVLLRCLIGKFGLEKTATAHDNFLSDGFFSDQSNSHPDVIYLWVKRSNFAAFQSIFELELQ